MTASSVLQSLVKDFEIGFLLDYARVTIQENLPKIEIGSVNLDEIKQGDTVELTRWVADILNEMGFAETQEESFEVEMFKALSRERIQGATQLSSLDKEFYIKLKRFLTFMKENAQEKPTARQNYDRAAVSAYDLVTLRTGKLMALSTSSSPPADLLNKITPEERILFDAVQKLVSSWRATVIEGAT